MLKFKNKYFRKLTKFRQVLTRLDKIEQDWTRLNKFGQDWASLDKFGQVFQIFRSVTFDFENFFGQA